MEGRLDRPQGPVGRFLYCSNENAVIPRLSFCFRTPSRPRVPPPLNAAGENFTRSTRAGVYGTALREPSFDKMAVSTRTVLVKDDGDDSPKSKQEKTNTQQSTVEHSKIESEGQFITKGKPAKIFLMASSEMAKDTVIDNQGRNLNSVFLMNLLDALNGREDIALLRSKKQRFNPLTATGAFAKTFIKSFNIAGLPILVVIFGLLVWFRRASRKKHIQMMFQK